MTRKPCRKSRAKGPARNKSFVLDADASAPAALRFLEIPGVYHRNRALLERRLDAHNRSTCFVPGPKRKGAAMLIVMLMLLSGTATAMFAIHATTSEIRSSGYARQALQAEYVADAALTTAMANVDFHGPAAMVSALQLTEGNTTDMPGSEPDILVGRRNYRIYMADYCVDTASGSACSQSQQVTQAEDQDNLQGPLPRNSVGGERQPFRPDFAVDVNDDYVFTAVLAGNRSDSGSRLRYLAATYTARGRMVVDIDYDVGTDDDSQTSTDPRSFHEAASDARAYGVSGPFGL